MSAAAKNEYFFLQNMFKVSIMINPLKKRKEKKIGGTFEYFFLNAAWGLDL